LLARYPRRQARLRLIGAIADHFREADFSFLIRHF
jgi:hypothetical protein